MFVNCLGNTFDPVVILLHPMGITGEEFHEALAPYFRTPCCFVFPDQGGHGKGGRFISAEEEYSELASFLLKNGMMKIKLLLGASMGFSTGYLLMKDKRFEIDHIWFDGATLVNSCPLPEHFVTRAFVWVQHKAAKDSSFVKKTMEKIYGTKAGSQMFLNFRKLTEADIKNICRSYCNHELREEDGLMQKKMHIEWGSKDSDRFLSAKGLKKYFKDVVPVIRKGYTHCSYLFLNVSLYAEEIQSFMNNQP